MPYLFSTEEYADMVFIYGVCEGNAAVAVEEYRQRYPYRRIPNARTIITTFRTLRETGSLPSVKIQSDRPRQHDVNVEENIIAAVERSPGISTRRISKRFRVSQSNVWRTLNNNNLYPYHLQKIQHLQPGDNDHRLEYCNWLVNHRQLFKYILFTDESQFTRDGINNLRNQHSWAEVNPHATIARNFQYRFSINVWCGVIHDKLIGPFIFQERLTGQAYLQFLQEELPTLLEDVPLATRRKMYFQHDGAPPHFSNIVSAYLNHQFPNKWIGRGGPIHWPPRSPDHTPLDFCIWGWMKEHVYEVKVNSREALLDRINEAFMQLKESPVGLRKATRAILKRAERCIEVDGNIFEHLL